MFYIVEEVAQSWSRCKNKTGMGISPKVDGLLVAEDDGLWAELEAR